MYANYYGGYTLYLNRKIIARQWYHHLLGFSELYAFILRLITLANMY